MGGEKVINPKFYFEQIYPNLIRGMLIISFNLPDERKIEIKLNDVCGRFVHRQDIKKSKVGHNEILLKPQGLSAGVYFVRLNFGAQTAMRKVVMIK